MRLFRTLRHHTPEQILHRVLARGRRAYLAWTGARQYVLAPHPLPELRDSLDLGETVARKRRLLPKGAGSKAERILRGEFDFIGKAKQMGPGVDWRAVDMPHLWRFHLHYQNYLLDLALLGLPERAWELVAEWLRHNPISDKRTLTDAWHPYCVSRRIPNWVLLWQIDPAPREIRDTVVESVAQQSLFLVHNLERDLGGNHLLENVRGLAAAGRFFAPHSSIWPAVAADLLEVELAKQILPHGEHFERSPMYHCHVLELLLDVGDYLAADARETASLCRTTVLRMADFLGHIVHPDGGIPLLGDSVNDETPTAAALLDVVHPSRSPPSSGGTMLGEYWTFRDRSSFLLFDTGPVGAENLPAHAHCDLLTVEGTLAGQRLFVDTGVSSYDDDDLRSYCRSTAAHNVVQLGDLEQCEIWSRFRMGERGKPLARHHGSIDDWTWAYADHDGYRRAGVPRVQRWIFCRANGPWACIDVAAGSLLPLHTRLHLAPSVKAGTPDRLGVSLTMGDRQVRLDALSGEAKKSIAPLFESFNQPREAAVITITNRTLSGVVGWCLWTGTPGRAVLRETERGLILSFSDESREWRLSKGAALPRLASPMG